MNRQIYLPIVVALATTVAACDTTTTSEGTPEGKVTQRDVYASLEDCVADWGDTELCERQMKEAHEHAEKMAAAQAKSGGGAVPVIIPMFMGPEYSGTRSYTHNGKTITPTTTTSNRTANYYTSPGSNTRVTAYSAPGKPASPSTFSAARGGFGGTGSASAGS